ncbi:MAG: dihydroneopterin triphosphate diphosphatase [Gammaproteobacteria bacterium]
MPDAALKRPASVLVLVATHTGEVLLIERRFPAGFWQSVTGSLEWGESVPSAAHRELLEETGISAEAIEDLQIGARFYIRSEWRKRFAPGVRENREHWFRLWLDAPVPVRLSGEHVRAQWSPAREAVKRVASWSNRVALQRYILQPLCQELN